MFKHPNHILMKEEKGIKRWGNRPKSAMKIKCKKKKDKPFK